MAYGSLPCGLRGLPGGRSTRFLQDVEIQLADKVVSYVLILYLCFCIYAFVFMRLYLCNIDRKWSILENNKTKGFVEVKRNRAKKHASSHTWVLSRRFNRVRGTL